MSIGDVFNDAVECLVNDVLVIKGVGINCEVTDEEVFDVVVIEDENEAAIGMAG